MQDDEAFDRGIQIAQWTKQPFYVLSSNGWTKDYTGQFPDIPPRDGLTRREVKHCRFCKSSVASAFNSPVCSMCEILILEKHDIEEWRTLIKSGMRIEDASNQIAHNEIKFWDCVYGPLAIPVGTEDLDWELEETKMLIAERMK